MRIRTANNNRKRQIERRDRPDRMPLSVWRSMRRLVRQHNIEEALRLGARRMGIHLVTDPDELALLAMEPAGEC